MGDKASKAEKGGQPQDDEGTTSGTAAAGTPRGPTSRREHNNKGSVTGSSAASSTGTPRDKAHVTSLSSNEKTAKHTMLDSNSKPRALEHPCNLKIREGVHMAGLCRCRQARCRQTGMRCISATPSYLCKFEFNFQGHRYLVHRFINSGAHAHAFLAHEILSDTDGQSKSNGDEHDRETVLGRAVCAKFFHRSNDKELGRLDDISNHKYYKTEPNQHVIEVVGFSDKPIIGAASHDLGEERETSAKNGSMPGQYGFVLMEMGHLGEVLDYIYEGNRIAPFSERFTRRFFKQLLTGLKFMHDHGVWHRDLKPENIIFDVFGNIKICDFGLAKTVVPLVDRVQKNPMQTSMMATRKQGSPSYMSPEMVAGKPYNERTDVWSCGCTLLVIACGKLPPTNFYHRACDFRFVEEFMGPGFSDDMMSMLRTIFVKNHRDRASLEDLLDCKWLQNEDEMATDEELTELFVSRNPNRVKKGIEWAPKHSQDLRIASINRDDDGKEEAGSALTSRSPSSFYATLIGKYVRSTGSVDGDKLLDFLGLQRFTSDMDSSSIDELEMLMEPPEGMTQDEYAYLGTALVAAGYKFDWAIEAASQIK